ncbi:MAG: PilZ domain-containing protein [Thermodesulfobacteriota bacterium]
MEGSFNSRERRSYPRFIVDLPFEYRDLDGSCLRGGIVANASEGGFLIEAVRDIPVCMELDIAVLFPKGFELANFKVVAKIVRKEPYRKQDLKGDSYWKGFKYGLEFIQILEEDRWKLSLLLGGRFESEEISPSLRSQHY